MLVGPHLFFISLSKLREPWLISTLLFLRCCTQALLSIMTASSFACLNGTQCRNELKGLLILNLITLLCPSAAFTLITFLWFSTFCFLINHLLIRALLFYTCPCHSCLRVAPVQSCSTDFIYSFFRALLMTHGLDIWYRATSASQDWFGKLGGNPKLKCPHQRSACITKTRKYICFDWSVYEWNCRFCNQVVKTLHSSRKNSFIPIDLRNQPVFYLMQQ